MLHRGPQLIVSFVAVICPVLGLGQATPRESFVVCGSQPNEPTVYFSAVLEGPATAFQGFRAGFTTFLSQRYGYKGAVGCLAANTAVNAQNLLNTRSTALRSQKKNVVETGWTETAAAAAPAAPPTLAMKQPATPPGSASSVANTTSKSQPAAAGGGGDSPLTSILGSIFGTAGGGGGGATASGAKAGGAAGAAHGASGAAASGGTGGTGDQSGLAQVSSTLASVFASKPANGTTAAPSAPESPPAASSDSGLGSAQAHNTKLVVYGCGRQDTQVACVTELTNQNHADTLVHSTEIWKDAFIVDDRGDRHQRTGGFFLNIDGDQRPQLDISYGTTARFILMFDGVPAKVQKVALRSSTGGLDVEEIALLAPNADSGKH